MRMLRPGWLVLYALLIMGGWWMMRGEPVFDYEEPLRVEEGATLYGILGDLSWSQKYKIKRYIARHDIDTSRLEVGTYDDIVGKVTLSELLDKLADGPSSAIIKVKLLEGWSIYDIDDYLTKKGWISAGEYLSYVSNRDGVRDDFAQRNRYANGQWSSDYAFLDNKKLDSGLEGVLYPDTYHLDRGKPVIPQLVRLQLKGFAQKIWPDLSTAKLQQGLSWYDALILASIVEKEERLDANKAAIAGVFYNRITQKMRLGADITLCYGLQQGYESCTPEVIVQHLYDDTNLYNTRALAGLTPTPIVTPTVSSMDAVLNPAQHNDLYYLHDPTGQIHMGATNAEHEQNKAKYLR